jgi:hypothetical protein
MRNLALLGESLHEHCREADIPSGAKQAAEKLEISGEIGGKCPSAAKAGVDSASVMRGLKPPPPSESSFYAACKARADFAKFMYGLKPIPFKASTYTGIL